MDPNTHRVEAERWLGIAMKLLTARDFLGSKTFAIRAKDSDPNNDMSDQILAVVETVLAGEKRVNSAQHPDWYSVLQLPRLVRDPDLIANHYRRLVMLLNPERNRLPFADYGLQLVVDAWTVLSDPTKKWLFDNELAVYLQRLEQQHQPPPPPQHHQQHQPQQHQPVRVEAMRIEVDHHHHHQQQQLSAAAAVGVSSPVAVAAQSNPHINTFQFFQPQPPPQQSQQQQQQQQQTVSMWQQQQQQQQQQLELELLQNQNQNHHQQQQHSNNNQLHQIEFMQPPPLPQQHQHPPQQQQQLLPQLLPQWQMRDPTPSKGGERNKGVLNGIGVGLGVTVATTSTASATSSTVPVTAPAPAPIAPTAQMGAILHTSTSQTMRVAADAAPRGTTVLTPTRTAPSPVPAPPVPVAIPVAAREVVTAVTSVVDGNVKNVGINNVVVVSNSNANDGGGVHEEISVVVNNNNSHNNNNNAAAAADVDDDENKVEEEEVESFWTSCPYCFYIFEYQKMYQDCTLRCQNCRRGFHAVQIPSPPSIRGTGGSGDGDEKGKETSFCCWGFVPVGFSTAAWKKHNRMGKANVASNWVPFSPMFACPTESGDGNFQWFQSSEAAAVGPKNMGPPASRPRVYVDEDFEVFNSDPSDSDSSDQDWRRNPVHEKKRKKRRGKVGAVGRPRKVKPQNLDMQNQANNNLITARRVTVASHALEGVPTTRKDIVVGLTAGAKEDTRRKVTATLTKNQARRRVKNMGRLDLNVEFNNDGDEHAPPASAVNGAETGVENIEFFEGLDEFLSTLPILNVGGDEKPKPS